MRVLDKLIKILCVNCESEYVNYSSKSVNGNWLLCASCGWGFPETDEAKLYSEEIDRTAEGIREFLGDFNDIPNNVKYEALKLVAANFQEALKD